MRKKPSAVWSVSVTTLLEAEDAVSALCSELLGEPATIYTDAETGSAVVTVYCRRRTRPSDIVKELREALSRIRACGLNLGPGKVRLKPLLQKDWAESWKKHFRPLEIGARLLIKPGWSRRKPRKNQALVILDPGLSFGTGQHPTTSYCLQQLVAWRDQRKAQGFFDVGTGSGILAIAAAKLGYQPVHAVDVDPTSVRVARANAAHNGVQDLIRISKQDIARMPGRDLTQYDVICANLTDEVLLETAPVLSKRLKPGGKLVVAGLLSAQFPPLQVAYVNAGLSLLRSRLDGDWRSAVFSRAP